MGSWRKAYGALKDSTKVGLAKVNSEFKVSHGDRDPVTVDSEFSPTVCLMPSLFVWEKKGIGYCNCEGNQPC